MNKFAAELTGTMVLVLFGCGSAVLGGPGADRLAVAMAFGLAIVAVAYGLGAVSGAHVNPAVSLAAFLDKRMSARQMLLYWTAQFIGALVGAAVLAAIRGDTAALGQNGWGPGHFGEYSLASAALFEVVMTAVFVGVVLGSTAKAAPKGMAGLAIGLTLAGIHIVGIPVTGVSVNPARSFGPALLAGGEALSQLWLFIIAPLAGAALGALPYRLGLFEPRPGPRASSPGPLRGSPA